MSNQRNKKEKPTYVDYDKQNIAVFCSIHRMRRIFSSHVTFVLEMGLMPELGAAVEELDWM